MELRLEHDADAGQYRAYVPDDAGGPAGLVAYRDRGDQRDLFHTEVRPELEGQGIAGRLAAFAIDDIRDSGLRLVPGCPYIADYVDRHPEYGDLVVD